MPNNFIRGGAIVLMLTFAACAQVHQNSSSTLVQRVTRLGSINNDDFADVEALSVNPRMSCGLLVAELHTIPEVLTAASENKPSTTHVIWVLRALRYLTGGMDFYATTTHSFDDKDEEQNRVYWLTFQHKSKNELAFFALWPSRDRLYISPTDAQESIITKWRNWYKSSGDTFEYRPLKKPHPEKWLW